MGYNDKINRGTTSSHMGINLPLVDVGNFPGRVVGIAASGASVCALFRLHDRGLLKCWGAALPLLSPGTIGEIGSTM